MVSVTAKLQYLRISPRKVRLVADLIRGMKVTEAESQLKFLPKRAVLPLLKLLNSAVANAKHNFGIEKENLFIFKIIVNTGPILKRWRPRSRGMAVPIKKRSSHIEIVLEERVEKGAKRKEIKKIEKKLEKAKKTDELREPAKEGAEKVGGEEKAEKKFIFRPEKEILKPKKESVVKRVFRRKAF